MRRGFAFIVVLALLPLSRGRSAEPTTPPPPQGAAFLKTDILGVFAHPDDETGMAATIAHYALGQGKAVAHAYVTRGEGGGNMVGTQSGPALGILREAELRDCLRMLGVRHCYFLDQTDFFYTESLRATLRKWDFDDALRRLVRLVRALRPEIVVTMNPAPNAGQHGHHQAAGVLATEAFAAAADPDRFPEQLETEGLAVWQARKLFYGGASGTHVVTIATTTPLADGRVPADIAGEALSHHRSQAFGAFARSPWLRRPQTFTLVKTTVAPAAETDLLAGLPASDPVHLISFAAEPPMPLLQFVARPAITHYLAWSRRMGLGHLSAEFTVDQPVVAGEKTPLWIWVATPPSQLRLAHPRLELPAGWSAELTGIEPAEEPGYPSRLRFGITAPADTLADAEVVSRATIGGTSAVARARLHPVPRAAVPATRRPPSIDGLAKGWEAAATLEIGTNRLWQGRVDGPADASALVRVLRDSKNLYVAVDVRDDVVVSNIEPNDIKGHWRSDSVEICLDPAGGAEDTTGCLKIGIFPFDTTGRIRAARDADARQGPVEEMAPGLRLASRRIEDGYRVEAAIPFALLEVRGSVPRRIGFNVLIYDGDKADAAPGENINEARLAWSPRSGVQGRPEDWGRLDLRR